MGDELLDAVFALESRIQLELQLEQERAERWLEMVGNEQRDLLEEAQRNSAVRERQTLEAARIEAEEEAAAQQEKELQYCRCLTAIDDTSLLEVLRRHLKGILPGQADDHQNGQG